MIGGLAIVGLFLGLYFGLGYPDAIEQDAAHGFLRCKYGYDLINGKCTDIDECIEDKGIDLITMRLIKVFDIRRSFERNSSESFKNFTDVNHGVATNTLRISLRVK